MHKRTFQNYMSLEKRKFLQNVKRLKAQCNDPLSVECGDSDPLTTSSFIVDELSCASGPMIENSASMQNMCTNLDAVSRSPKSVNETINLGPVNRDMCVELKGWVQRNNISQNALSDLLQTLNTIGIKGVPTSAKTLLGTNMTSMTTPNSQDYSFEQKNWEATNVYHEGPTTSKRGREQEINSEGVTSSIKVKEEPETGDFFPCPERGQEINSEGPTSFIKVKQATETEATHILSMILEKQTGIEHFMEKVDDRLTVIEQTLAHNVVESSEMMAQNHLTRECEVSILREVQQSVSHMTGKIRDAHLEEISAKLPIEDIHTCSEIEQNLKTPEFRQAMITYMYNMKGDTGSVNDVIRKLFTDEFLKLHNWDGRWERMALRALKLVDELLFDVFKSEGRKNFEKDVKKSIELSHNRLKQKIRLLQRKFN